MKHIFLVLLLGIFSFGTLSAQSTITPLEGNALQEAVKQNVKNGKKDLADIFYMQIIKTNQISVSPEKVAEMLSKLKAIPSVFEAKYDPTTFTLQVMNKPQISKVAGEQIKAVIVPYGYLILGYDQYFYQTK